MINGLQSLCSVIEERSIMRNFKDWIFYFSSTGTTKGNILQRWHHYVRSQFSDNPHVLMQGYSLLNHRLDIETMINNLDEVSAKFITLYTNGVDSQIEQALIRFSEDYVLPRHADIEKFNALLRDKFNHYSDQGSEFLGGIKSRIPSYIPYPVYQLFRALVFYSSHSDLFDIERVCNIIGCIKEISKTIKKVDFRREISHIVNRLSLYKIKLLLNSLNEKHLLAFFVGLLNPLMKLDDETGSSILNVKNRIANMSVTVPVAIYIFRKDSAASSEVGKIKAKVETSIANANKVLEPYKITIAPTSFSYKTDFILPGTIDREGRFINDLSFSNSKQYDLCQKFQGILNCDRRIANFLFFSEIHNINKRPNQSGPVAFAHQNFNILFAPYNANGPVLAHELGHLLGADHIDDPNNLMHASYDSDWDSDYKFFQKLGMSQNRNLNELQLCMFKASNLTHMSVDDKRQSRTQEERALHDLAASAKSNLIPSSAPSHSLASLAMGPSTSSLSAAAYYAFLAADKSEVSDSSSSFPHPTFSDEATYSINQLLAGLAMSQNTHHLSSSLSSSDAGDSSADGDLSEALRASEIHAATDDGIIADYHIGHATGSNNACLIASLLFHAKNRQEPSDHEVETFRLFLVSQRIIDDAAPIEIESPQGRKVISLIEQWYEVRLKVEVVIGRGRGHLPWRRQITTQGRGALIYLTSGARGHFIPIWLKSQRRNSI